MHMCVYIWSSLIDYNLFEDWKLTYLPNLYIFDSICQQSLAQ